MAHRVKILGIAGSLRSGSYNKAALRAAKDLVPEDAYIETFDRLAEVPPFNQDFENDPPEVVQDLKRQIREADAVVFAIPEYNYSVPGVLKNAIDWASRPMTDNAWAGKSVAVMGASVGMLGSARAQYHLRQAFVFLDMYAVNLPEVLIANADQRFSDGELIDETSRQLIADLLDNLVTLTRKLQTPV